MCSVSLATILENTIFELQLDVFSNSVIVTLKTSSMGASSAAWKHFRYTVLSCKTYRKSEDLSERKGFGMDDSIAGLGIQLPGSSLSVVVLVVEDVISLLESFSNFRKGLRIL